MMTMVLVHAVQRRPQPHVDRLPGPERAPIGDTSDQWVPFTVECRRSKTLGRTILAGVLLLFLGTAWTQAADPGRAAWRAQKPVIVDGRIADWTSAPEFLEWRKADPDRDGFAGEVLTVTLTGPFHKDTWSQHAGALFALGRTFPKGQSFTVRFKARSLEGSRHLSVLRTWGGAKPWDTIEIGPDWKDYQVTIEPQADTESLTFSLAPKKGRLQPYCAGRFELARIEVSDNGQSGD